MLDDMLVPLAVSSALALIVALVHRRLPPRLAARATTVALAVVAAAAIPTVWITAISSVWHAPFVDRWLDWCTHALGGHSMTHHETVRPVIGVPAVAITVIGLVRAWRVVRRYQGLRQRDGGIETVEHDDLFAFTMPGPGGRIVISRGMRRALDDRELAVVLAHEAAHGRHRHDRYLVVAQLAAALLAPLAPLVRRLQFSLERWADEVAVDRCGDRTLVARTLGRIALVSADAAPALSFTGLGVPARMGALLAPRVDEPGRAARAGLWAIIALAAVFAGFQLHHLVGMLLDLCTD